MPYLSTKHVQCLLKKIYMLSTHTLRFSISMDLLLDFELQEVTPTWLNKGMWCDLCPYGGVQYLPEGTHIVEIRMTHVLPSN